jgi:nitrogen fixation NifU-like protein
MNFEGYSAIARDHAAHPRNWGALEGFNGGARITGPCGDTMMFWVLIHNDTVEKASFVTDGCGSSLACGSMATTLAEGKAVEEVTILQQSDILKALGAFPAASEHCALLAAVTLSAACRDYLRRGDGAPGAESVAAPAL